MRQRVLSHDSVCYLFKICPTNTLILNNICPGFSGSVLVLNNICPIVQNWNIHQKSFWPKVLENSAFRVQILKTRSGFRSESERKTLAFSRIQTLFQVIVATPLPAREESPPIGGDFLFSLGGVCFVVFFTLPHPYFQETPYDG